jgi:hypothetical protein
MAQRETNRSVKNELHGPPMPKALFKLVNPLLKLMLNSPLHGQMSRRLMVLSFTGHKSGRRYSTPVGYVRQGSDIFVFTHSLWRNNFLQPAPVTMRIQGEDLNGTATLVRDPARIKGMIQALTIANGEEMARRMGFWVENLEASGLEEMLQATRGTYFIEIKLSGGI